MKEKNEQNQKTTKPSSNLNSNFQNLTSDNRGITLIALIITVIILLILIGLTIDIAVDGKLVDNARETVGEANNKLEQEQQQRDNALSNWINESGTGTKGGTQEYIVRCAHTYGEWEIIKEPTSTELGERTRTCTKCGYTQTEYIKGNNAPTINSVTLNTKTTNSFTVDVTASDSDGEELTYSLYVNGSSEPAETKTVSQSSEAVQLTASSLNMYTDYTYYVTVTDNTDSAQSEEATVKTKCSGKTTTCTTSSCATGKTTTCTTCSGTGKCTKCSGTGTIRCYHPSSGITTTVGDRTGDCNTCSGPRYFQTDKCSTCAAEQIYTACWSCGDESVNIYWPYYRDISCRSCSSGSCSTCSGNKNIYTYCSHDLADSHRYCDHYTDTDITDHYICDHSTNGAEHE